MNLISQRPGTWAEVVGQPRVVTLLHAVLNHPQFLLRGFLFFGPIGVGKTSVAYLLAKALMCQKTTLGCSSNFCPSCERIVHEGIDQHYDFKEIDAAETPGVAHARDIMDGFAAHTPILGKRRIIILDEAHNLSGEAWDVFLKPLEQGNPEHMNTLFIFVTNQPDNIKATIRSRILRVEFERLHADTIRGYLVKKANDNSIPYELEALTLIAKHAKGIVREALNSLNMVAAVGRVTADLTRSVLDTSLEESCVRLLLAVAAKDFGESIRQLDELARKAPSHKIIENLFAVYGRAVFEGEGGLQPIYTGLPNVAKVTALFIKWLKAPNLPGDALLLLGYELLQSETRNRASVSLPPPKPAAPIKLHLPTTVPPPKPDSAATPEQLAAYLSDPETLPSDDRSPIVMED